MNTMIIYEQKYIDLQNKKIGSLWFSDSFFDVLRNLWRPAVRMFHTFQQSKRLRNLDDSVENNRAIRGNSI